MTQSASDGQLLSDVADGSESRFAELVRRHGPMVLAACRRQLGNHADAEDAAQAVFLLLWQQARRLRHRPSVAGWLHHAARNICRNALRARTVRNEHERNAAGAVDDETGHQRLWDQIKDLLDDELDHLPEKYRVPIVLFHLEGRSLEEIGVLLHLKESTVGTRLTRGRERLRQRLQRRGIALPAAGLATLISQNAGHAAMPLFFAEKTARAACLLAMGRLVTGELISTHAVALSKGAMRMQTMAKLKTVAAVVVFSAIVAGIGMVIAQQQAQGELPEQGIPDAPADKKTPTDETSRERPNTTKKNGLSVSLVAMQQTFMEGEHLRFSGTVKNVSDKDFRFYPHPSWYLGWEVTIEDGPWQVVSLLKGKRQPPVLLLKAGQAQGIGMIIGDNFAYRWGGPKKKPVPRRDHLKPGKYKLRAVMKFIKNETPGAPFWTGTIKTPPVAFEIVADPIPARLRQVEWGKETNGLVAKFRAVKNVVKPGEPMQFELLVKNVSKEDIRFLGENGRLSPQAWRFHFGDWVWSSPIRPTAMRLKPGDTASVRCLVATTRDSLTAEQKRLFFAGPFHNVKTGEKSTRLPEGVYRVRAATTGRTFTAGRLVPVETNVIEVRISDGRDGQEKNSP